MTEAQIQRAVFQHLRQRPALGVFAWHTPNGGYRRKHEGAILNGLGVVAGVPDVVAVKDGHCFGLELKAEGGTVSPKQVQALQAMQSAGATVACVYGLNQALEKLEAWGLLAGRAS